jgi:hypothetical protein
MRVLIAAADVVALAVAPAAARAAQDQEPMFQDDALLVYGSPAEQSNALQCACTSATGPA